MVSLDAPVTLAITAAAGFILLMQSFFGLANGEALRRALAVLPWRYMFSGGFLRGAARLLLYPLAHRDSAHFLANFASILLAGPRVEAQIGSARMAALLLANSVITGIVHAVAVKGAGLIGASGAALLLLVLLAASDVRSLSSPKESRTPSTLVFPLPLLLLLALHAVREFGGALAGDAGVSHLAHFVGIAAGAGAGLSAGWL